MDTITIAIRFDHKNITVSGMPVLPGRTPGDTARSVVERLFPAGWDFHRDTYGWSWDNDLCPCADGCWRCDDSLSPSA